MANCTALFKKKFTHNPKEDSKKMNINSGSGSEFNTLTTVSTGVFPANGR